MLYSRVTGSRVSRLRFVLGILNCRALVSVQDPPKMSASDITPLLDLGYSNCRRVSRKRVGRWLLLDDSFYRLDKMSECCQSSQRVTTNCCCCCRSGCQSSQRVTAAGGHSAENENPSHPCLPAARPQPDLGRPWPLASQVCLPVRVSRGPHMRPALLIQPDRGAHPQA